MVPVFNPHMSYIQKGYLNANVSMNQNKGTVGFTNESASFVIAEMVGGEDVSVLLKALEHKMDAFHNPMCNFPTVRRKWHKGVPFRFLIA